MLCINGTGILNRWIKNITGNSFSYQQMNAAAAAMEPGSDGLIILPFGNGAERMFENKILNSDIQNMDFNITLQAHFTGQHRKALHLLSVTDWIL